MPAIDEEMKNLANFAIKTAYERYRFNLDYSEQSIVLLEEILEKIYWGFSGRTEDTGEGGLIYNAATIWGSYLGEYMLMKWGGNWVSQSTKRLVTIKSIQFSPVDFVYQKILGNTKDRVDSYLLEINKKLAQVPGASLQTMFVPVASQSPDVRVNKKSKPQVSKSNKGLYALIGALSGITIILIVLTIGFIRMMNSGIQTSEMFQVLAPTNTATQTDTATPTATPSFTITMLPTYTPKPTNTPKPTKTPTPTNTSTFTPTPTSTETETPTEEPYTPPPTKTPTRTQVPPTRQPPTAAPTEPPPPSDTPVPPVAFESCSVNPSTIDPGYVVILKFTGKFSSPGYGFSTSLNPQWPGASACGATDDNGDGTASCDASSGMLPSSSTVTVVFSSSVGNCSASYHTP